MCTTRVTAARPVCARPAICRPSCCSAQDVETRSHNFCSNDGLPTRLLGPPSLSSSLRTQHLHCGGRLPPRPQPRFNPLAKWLFAKPLVQGSCRNKGTPGATPLELHTLAVNHCSIFVCRPSRALPPVDRNVFSSPSWKARQSANISGLWEDRGSAHGLSAPVFLIGTSWTPLTQKQAHSVARPRECVTVTGPSHEPTLLLLENAPFP